MHSYLMELLVCPGCHGQLAWSITESFGHRIEAAQATCEACRADYPVWDGIGLFLTPDLPRHDLWEEVDNQLGVYLDQHPEVEWQLMDTPLDALAPSDQYFRAVVLEGRGDYAQARVAAEQARGWLYTAEYLACHHSQINYLVEHVSGSAAPIVDLASGRCELVERLAARLDTRIVASDFSPRVLRGDRRWLEFFGLYDQVSLLALDTRRMPFKNGVVDTMTTNLGLSNIEQPGDLPDELRRVLQGEFLAITHFFPEDDEANAAAISELGLAPFLFRKSTLNLLSSSGFDVELKNVQRARAAPTPTSLLLEGAGIDALPVAETELEWCVLVAR
jgi:uncharacterized protein YbaR (Trm112 family)